MKILILPALLVAAAPAIAQAPVQQTLAEGAAETVANQSLAVPPRTDRKSPMLTDKELDTQRGGEVLVITDQTMTAITSGNRFVGDYTAGAVSLSDFALSNFNGVGNLLINTGAQVSAQSGMNLTINLGN
jgi:hypothetical protein